MKLNLTHAAIVCLAATMAAPVLAQDSGADTFKTKCLMCHGADGTANTPAGKAFKAASFKDPMVTTKSNEELATVIKTGKDKLTDDQIKAVIAYIRALPN